jgi:hypothetical protein
MTQRSDRTRAPWTAGWTAAWTAAWRAALLLLLLAAAQGCQLFQNEFWTY